MKPLVKWVGGKTRLLPELVKRLPEDYARGRHVELFAGGAALYFHLEPEVAWLSDVNERLMHAYTTVREHMPSSHRRYADWTPEKLRRQAAGIGPNTGALVEIILRERSHPEQGFRSCVAPEARVPRDASCGWPNPMAGKRLKRPVNGRWRVRHGKPPSVRGPWRTRAPTPP